MRLVALAEQWGTVVFTLREFHRGDKIIHDLSDRLWLEAVIV